MEYVHNKAVAVLLLAIVALLVPATLQAHAVLVESNPKASSTVKGPDFSVTLRFNVRVDGSRSRSTVVLPDGTTVPLNFDPQVKPNILSGKASGLAAGKYKLQWQVLAADGHITRGEFSFNVE
jgi:methionine-rich copper-binding protein CopC